METYHCFIVPTGDGHWNGAVSLVDSYFIHLGKGRRLYTSNTKGTQAEAAEDARNWCERKGIHDYLGPIISGMIG